MYRLKKLLLEDGNNTKTFGEMYAGKRFDAEVNSPCENRESAERIDLVQMMDELYEKISKEGIDCVYSGNFSECGRNLALPRKQDFLAVIYRMRKTEYIDSI